MKKPRMSLVFWTALSSLVACEVTSDPSSNRDGGSPIADDDAVDDAGDGNLDSGMTGTPTGDAASPRPAPSDAGSDEGTMTDAEAPDSEEDAATADDAGPTDVDVPLTPATMLTVGTEAVLVGGDTSGSLIPGTSLAMEEGYAVNSYALSRDGSVVWFTLYNEFAEEGEWWQVWSIGSNGSNPMRSSLPLPENWGFPGGFELAVNEDGSVAFLVVPIGISAAVLPDRELQIFRATERGGAFAQVGTTEDVEDFDSLGLAQAVFPRATSDGLSVIVNGGGGIWRFGQGDGWVPFKIGDKTEIFFKGEPPPGNARFQGLDIDANGGKWITSILFDEPEAMWAVVTGTSIPLTTIEDIRLQQAQTRLELDDFGETVAFTYNGEVLGEATSVVGEQGGARRILTADVDAVVDVALSGDGEWLHAVNKPNSFETVHTSFFERVEDGSGRVKAHSEAFGGNGILGGLLSSDGNVMVAAVNVGSPVAGTPGLWSMSRNEMGRDGSPEILDIGYRFDEEDNLVVRITADASEPITNVYVLPLYERYVDPVVVQPSSEENPFLSIRFGREIPAIDDMSGAYEGTLPIDRELLDERYSLRAVVVSGPEATSGNKASFADFFVE